MRYDFLPRVNFKGDGNNATGGYVFIEFLQQQSGKFTQSRVVAYQNGYAVFIRNALYKMQECFFVGVIEFGIGNNLTL